MAETKINFTFSNLEGSINHYGDLTIQNIGIAPLDYSGGFPINYETVMDQDTREDKLVSFQFMNDSTYAIEPFQGITPLGSGGNFYSFYRREYQEYQSGSGSSYTYKGQWEPVNVNVTDSVFRDFNVKSGYTYQYILYPKANASAQKYANALTPETSKVYGAPVTVKNQYWSIVELVPQNSSEYNDTPALSKIYKADLNNLWMFKYNLETGSQTQNLSKSEIKTLGQYPRMGYGASNYISGEISCLLGSELVPYTKYQYLERSRESILHPVTTNDKAYMLQQWRQFAASKNPKLLKDIKGQSWIVQIISSSNTPKNFYLNQPDTISFQWRQLSDTKGIIITGTGETLPEMNSTKNIWEKKY